jgi:hypothetical protein
MASDQETGRTRFPWGYAVTALLPLALIAIMFVASEILGPSKSMGLAMACALLIGPVGGLVAIWGIYRLMHGEARVYPALRWLVWLPGLVSVAGLILG